LCFASIYNVIGQTLGWVPDGIYLNKSLCDNVYQEKVNFSLSQDVIHQHIPTVPFHSMYD
jgi:hypothetical protein